MDKQFAKEKNIKKAKRLQTVMKVYTKIKKFFAKKRKIDKKEICIEGQYGKINLLCYGFNNDEIKPICFDMHGGGFVLGNAYMDEEKNIVIMEKVGCKVVSIDYIKAPAFPFPAAVNQVYSVIEYFYENPEKYKINNQKMAIIGYSAGANLSTVSCMKAKIGEKFQFKCQILSYPVLDLLTDPYEKPKPKGALSPSMMQMFNDCYFKPEEAKNPFLSPVFAEKKDLQGLPPALIILAGKDSLFNEGKQYAEKLKEAGVRVTIYEYKNAKHGFTYERSTDRDDAVKKIAEYLDNHLNKDKFYG
jgi:acetyl esterase